nr:hypothetical protein [uncultured Acinetobacter sp.]
MYEADGGSSVKRMLEIVQNTTQIDELPSRQTVVARAKRENWQRPDSLQQLSTAKLQKIIQRANGMALVLSGIDPQFNDDEDEENQSYSVSERLDEYNNDALYHEQKNNIVNAAMLGVKKLLSTAIHKKKTKAQVIARARSSQDRLFLLRDHTLDQITLSVALLTNVQYKLIANETDLSNTEGIMNFNMRVLEMLNNTIAVNEKFIKTDFAIYGLTPDDVKEPETQGRMKDLNDDTEYKEQLERLQAQSVEMAARRHYIESGTLEKEISEEVRRKMIEAGMDDSDDDDYEDDE